MSAQTYRAYFYLISCVLFVQASVVPLSKHFDGVSLREALSIVKNEYEILRGENTKLRDEVNLYRQAVDTDSETNQLIVHSNQMPKSCADIMPANDLKEDGIYQIYLPETGLEPFNVYCMRDPVNNGSAWTLLQRRQDGSVNFYRGWVEYEHGFGNLSGEHFIGLKKLHALTHSQPHELWISLMDFDGFKRSAKYDSFAIDGAENKYALDVLGKYFGDAGDSLVYHIGSKFSTKDADHDSDNGQHCANEFDSAGWYKSCQDFNLMGPYSQSSSIPEEGYGITWNKWLGNKVSLKYAHMAIRPIN